MYLLWWIQDLPQRFRLWRRLRLERKVLDVQKLLESIATVCQTEQAVGFKTGALIGAYRLSSLERSLTRSRVWELACVRRLAQAGRWDEVMLARYAWTGYQRLIPNHPLYRAVRLTYRGGSITREDLDIPVLRVGLVRAKTNQLRRLNPEMLADALAGCAFASRHPSAHKALREMLREPRASDSSRTIDRLVDIKSQLDRSTRNIVQALRVELVGDPPALVS